MASTKRSSSSTSSRKRSGGSSRKASGKSSARKSSSKKSSSKKSSGRKSSGRSSSKRELLDTGTSKRFMRRTEGGKFGEQDEVGRSLRQDRARKAKTTVKSGQGDRGDQKRRSSR